ncbi:helix-turn-helix domain-containing protein [Vagococcus carniphilus]|uniref:helix-turn-helix domain-containing protein n=1 Tax=Vagococcus carniphilus TaxID=218144 RepID=UPI00288D2693|nr:helix-turn-helix transcriptional regulator [Vagococcus carniphilus]MDT2866484.1 helix-turn-helix transcriptional regulator [Vagococcus carniphilus]
MNNIKKVMLDKNITFTELQEKTLISKSTLSPLINSKEIPKKTKLDTLERISSALKVSVTELLSDKLDLLAFNIEWLKNESYENLYKLKFSYEGYFFYGDLEYIQEYHENKPNLLVSESFELALNFTEDCNIPNDTFLDMFALSSKNNLRVFCENILKYLKIYLARTGSFSFVFSVSTNNSLEINSFFMGMFNKNINKYSLGRYKSDNELVIEMPY